MKHALLVLSVLLFSTLFSIAQVNMTLVSNLPYPELEGNDIWGYVAPDGTEYALMGLENGVSVVSLADPANPVEVAFADGPNSIWRDTKTWGQYAYSTNETGQGILVMDLSMLPDSMSYDYWVPETGVLGFFWYLRQKASELLRKNW